MRLSRRAKRRIVLLSVIVLVLVGCIAALWQFRTLQASRLLAEKRENGLAAYHDGRYEDALEPLSYVISEVKGDVEVLAAFAEARSRIPLPNDKHIGEAIASYNEVTRLDPTNLNALEQLLELYESVGMFATPEAHSAAQRILDLSPEHTKALHAVAAFNFTNRNFAEVFKHIEQLKTIEPGNVDWYMFDVYALQTRLESAGFSGDAERAIRTDDDILDLTDQWIDAWDGDDRFRFVRLYALYTLGRAADARSYVQNVRIARELGPQTPAFRIEERDVQRDLIRLLDQLDLSNEADLLVADAQRAFPDAIWVWEQAIRRAWVRHDLSAAEAELEAARGQFTPLAPALLKWDVLLSIANDSDEQARAALTKFQAQIDTVEHAEERTQLNAWGAAMEAYLALQSSNWSDVITKFQKAERLSRNDATLSYIMGDAYNSVNELDLAAQAYEEAWREQSNWIAAGLAYANTLLELGRPQDAISVCLRLGPGSNAPAAVNILFTQAWIAMSRAYGSIAEAESATGTSLDQLIAAFDVYLQRNGVDNALVIELLGQLYALDQNPDAMRPVLDAILASGDEASFDVIAAAVRSSMQMDGYEQKRLIALAERSAPTLLQLAELRAWVALRSGATDRGLELIDSLRDEARGQASFDSQAWDQMQALYLARSGKHEEAVAALRSLLIEYPDSTAIPGLVLAQAVTWTNKELVDRAIEAQQAIQGDVRTTRLLLAEATRTLRFNRDDGAAVAAAKSKIAQALAQSPNSFLGLTLMADALLAMDDPATQEAIEYLQRAVERYPSRTDLAARLVSLYQQVGNTTRALEWNRRLLGRRDLSSDVLGQQVRFLSEIGNFQEAITALERSDAASSEGTRLKVAALQVRSSQFAEAEETLRAILREGHSELAVRLLAESHVAQGSLEKGVALLEESHIEGGPGARDARLASLYQFAGRTGEAVAHYREAVNAEPRNAHYWADLGLTLLRSGDADGAREAAMKGMEHDSALPELRRVYAMASLEAGNAVQERALALLREQGAQHEKLIDTLEVFRRVDIENPTSSDLAQATALTRRHRTFLPAWRLAVQLHQVSNDIPGALRIARDAMLLLGSDPEPAKWATELALKTGQLADALDAAQSWRSRSYESTFEPDMTLATIYLRLSRPQAAALQVEPHVPTLLKDVREQPSDEQTRAIALTAVQAMVSAGRLDAIRALMVPLLDEQPAWRQAWARIATDLRRVDVAQTMLTMLTQHASPSADERLLLADAWSRLAYRTGEDAHFKEAVNHALEVASISEEDAWRSYLLAGAIEELRGKYQVAESHYRASLDRMPDNPYALNNLANVIARDESRLEEAENLVRRALAKQSETAAFLDTYAVILKRQGRLEEAEERARQAVAIAVENPEPHLTLAEILHELARPEEALQRLARTEALMDDASDTNRQLRERVDALRKRIEEKDSLTHVN